MYLHGPHNIDLAPTQIWFQNRRQTSRRKSRPLLPHEIAQYQLSRAEASPHLSSDHTDSSFQEEDQPSSAEIEAQLQDELESEHRGQVIASSASDDLSDTVKQATTPSVPSSSSSHLPSQAESQSQGSFGSDTSERIATTAPPPHPTQSLDQTTSHLGYLASRKSAPSLRHSAFSSDHPPNPHPETNSGSNSRLKKASSFVRLSMTGEGNAKVVTKDSSSPSPPHASQGPPPSTHGTANHHLSIAASRIPPMRPLQRSSSGRARDSRVWEFWCDKEARSELEETAEKDASGSAVGAIGLLRSTSGRNVLGSIPSKRNSLLSRPAGSAKRTKVESRVPKLHKSSTALGRLEGKLTEKTKHSDVSGSVHIPGNESDKENWSPSTAMSPDDQSEQSSHYEGSHGVTQPSSFTKDSHKSPRASFSNFERSRPETDPEVAAFMRGGRKSNSISGDEELDCVQGLLSLSQGNWR